VAQPGLMGALFLAASIALAGMPPLSGFVGKLLILDAWRDHAFAVWSAILVSSFLMILGLARAGSNLFWKPVEAAPKAKAEPLALLATLGLVAALVALTVLGGPVTDWLAGTAEALHDPAGYLAANRLPTGG